MLAMLSYVALGSTRSDVALNAEQIKFQQKQLDD